MIHYSKEEIFAAKKQVVKAQVDRFKVTYKNYFERPDTIQMVNYFFDKIYNLDAKAEWVDLAISSFDKIKSMIKDETRESMERLIELNNLTDKLDTQMAYLIIEKNWTEGYDLTPDEFKKYFIELGHSEERFKQLEIVLLNLRQFYDLAHRPINAVLIKPARFMAKILGIYPLFATIEEGYHACLPVNRELFESFFAEVDKTEHEYLRSCFPNFGK
ncbi:MAG TPA: hypothetical protein PK079_24755 [Leptospiraceae bacterium]|nr:hypothetical protein [Leptospiraceae bacterium]HMW04529.1 hypothetical protein [Leptospiraceae bacterium]HMX31187.1 hypothetical protein [Leptospiraceae bacterium]HMY30715.1 hypothetical protein [Leptospiraceae bacterium]HMZ63216.1 hypothetical protein [Leptospiraceae bacterium]